MKLSMIEVIKVILDGDKLDDCQRKVLSKKHCKSSMYVSTENEDNMQQLQLVFPDGVNQDYLLHQLEMAEKIAQSDSEDLDGQGQPISNEYCQSDREKIALNEKEIRNIYVSLFLLAGPDNSKSGSYPFVGKICRVL